MKHEAISIRPFIGANNFTVSRNFYRDLGFEEIVLAHNFSVFKINEKLSFYLQDASVKDWIDNTQLFLEVDNLDHYWNELSALNLPAKYEGVRLSAIQPMGHWGRECFLHDPSGILWHFGEFSNR